MKGFKAFDKDFKCNGFQFKEGETYEHKGDLKICEKGFHFCKAPFDVFNYKDIIDSRFAEVEAEEAITENDKSVTAKIRINKEIGLTGLIKSHIEFVFSLAFKKKSLLKKISSKVNDAQIGSSGNSAKIGSLGNNAKIGSSGYDAQIGSSGNHAKIGSSGDFAKIGSSGYDAQIGSSGNYAQIGSSGDSAKIGSSGKYARIVSSGYNAQIGSSGYDAKIGSSGKYSVVSAIGAGSLVKAATGSWIVLAEWKCINGQNVPFCVKAGQIGKGGLKENTWYKLFGGKFVEIV